MIRNLLGVFLKSDIDNRRAGTALEKWDETVKLLIQTICHFNAKGQAEKWFEHIAKNAAERTWDETQGCEISHLQLY